MRVESGEPLGLRYEVQRYGPYADNLRHVLKALEGHFLKGFGDGSAQVGAAGPRTKPLKVHRVAVGRRCRIRCR